jgi:hypothetical protein
MLENVVVINWLGLWQMDDNVVLNVRGHTFIACISSIHVENSSSTN